jgi:hypothetical protein
MAELDYAFLADFARVDANGTLTSVGASFTHVQVQTLPMQRMLSVAGRIRSRRGDPPVALRVSISTPRDEIQLSFDAQLQIGPGARPYTRLPTPQASICYIGPGLDGRDLKVWVVPHTTSVDTVTVKSAAWRGVGDDV